MCYSAGASLVASGGLATIGVASLRVAEKKHRILAAIPLFFAIQQAFEGYQWISLGWGNPSMIAAYGFLFFALLFWPVYVPVTVYLIEVNNRRLLRWLIFAGTLLALFFLVILETKNLSVYILDRSICYDLGLSNAYILLSIYILITCGAIFASRMTLVRWFGYGIFILALIAGYFYYYVFTSVWCFFAAVLSSVIYLYVRYPKKYLT